MTATPAVPRQLDPVAAEARERFGQLLLLPGLAFAHQVGSTAMAEHSMSPGWDPRGRLTYQCVPQCGLHRVLAAMADRSAWFTYCAGTKTAPHEITDLGQRRALFVAHVAHVMLTNDPGADPVTAIGWASFPAINLT